MNRLTVENPAYHTNHTNHSSDNSLWLTFPRLRRLPFRPHWLVVAQGHRWPGPMRRSFRKLERGRQMRQPSGRHVGLDAPIIDFLGGEFPGDIAKLRFRHLAAVNQPATGLREGCPNQPTAALSSPPRQRDHRAEGHEVASQVVDGGHRVELRPRLVHRGTVALGGALSR